MTMTRADRDAPMTPERLKALLATYGAAPSRWPHGERAAAEMLIDGSPEARALIAKAAQLDAMLDLVQPPAPSAALAGRVRDRRFGWRGFWFVSLGERFGRNARRWMVSPRHQAVAVCGALLIGVLVGTEIQDSTATAPLPAGIAAVERGAGAVAIAPLAPTGTSGVSIVSAAEPMFSSNGNPAFDAPDPFGTTAYGIDLIEGARISGVPAPASNEPPGGIPLL